MSTPINVIVSLMIVASFLVAIPLHEFAHAQVARWLGDPTPGIDGRYTLRLGPHIDALGTLLCVILAFMPVPLSMGLGWGKPVKIDPWKLRGGRNGGPIMVALSGMVFSLLLGLLFAFISGLLFPLLGTNAFLARIPQLLLVFGVVNICLALFNILPVYPLDGYQILYMLLPSKQAVAFAKSGPYGPFIILIVFFLLPFIAEFSGLGGFPLFHIPEYILLGGQLIASLVSGAPLDITMQRYFF